MMKFSKPELPGPGKYELRSSKSNRPYPSCFNDQSQREIFAQIDDYPSPGSYQISKNIIEKNFLHNGKSSFFSEKISHKKMNNDTQLKIIRNYLADNEMKGGFSPIMEEKTQYPSVGSYSVQYPGEVEPKYKRQHPYPGFIQGMKNRFGEYDDKDLVKD